MRHLTAIALLLAISAPLPAEEDAQTTPSPLDQAFAILHGEADQPQQDQPAEADMDVEVVEVFTAENAEALEAALADGYPPPWLAEILEDETIPEEDRYWLDCRIRAHIARHLHRFYDREGNPVEVEAEWIAPGERYWQEHLMVNPVGEDYGFGQAPEHLPDFMGEPGPIMDVYGDQIGELALVNDRIVLSRDASIGVFKSGPGSLYNPGGKNYICFEYSDGSFREVEADLGYDFGHMNVSWDGELVVACTTDPLLDRANGQALLFDRQGNLLHSTEIGGFPSGRPAISPDNRYVAIPLESNPTNCLVILDAETGELLRKFQDLWIRQIVFSPEGHLAGIASNINGISTVELSGTTVSWRFDELRSGRSGNYLGMALCSRHHMVAISGKTEAARFSEVLHEGNAVFHTQASNLDLSPNGEFGFSFNTRRAHPTDYEPSLVEIVSLRERG
jgi:hypothetical protein